jgi:PKD-like domain/CHU_C Type IX secretion signal domain
MKYCLPAVWLLLHAAIIRGQVCPLNSNWSSANLTHWEAYTGNNAGGNGPSAIALIYDSTKSAPIGTLGNNIIYEYQLPSVAGIQILSSSGTDPYGGFAMIPNINGYQYTNSILLGSTSVTHNGGNGAGGGNTGSGGTGTRGGYVRGVRYRINVPPGPVTEPYTMTYAYAMVLENGSHASNEQPLFSATLITNDSVITCASPQYFLPTLGSSTNGAILDTALAGSEGFFLSPRASPNPSTNPTQGSTYNQDVWAKNWTEVTFDLSPYRGQQVVLDFETDNCVPGGHFAYSYVTLRNTCGGLLISGNTEACINSTVTFTVPNLTGATYQWTAPGDWPVISGGDTSVLHVKVGNDPGVISVREQNSCANLTATLNLKTTLPTLAGAVSGGIEVCEATTIATDLTENGSRGSILSWLVSTDGVTWTRLGDTTAEYTVRNLSVTTTYRVLVQNGTTCTVDTSAGTTMLIDPLSVGGKLQPSSQSFCLGQNKDALLQLTGATGSPVNWQMSADEIGWAGFNPVYTATAYTLSGLTATMYYRVIVQSGICPADTSTIANVNYVNIPFPQASIDPADTLICYGASAGLQSVINIGTGYSWTNTGSLTGQGNGVVGTLPYVIHATASPASTIDYVLNVENAGCPNSLLDTFHVRVLPRIVVNPGNDTSVVVGEPLQLQASSIDPTSPGGDSFSWTPVIGLNNPDIFDPVASFPPDTDSVRYFVTATAVDGCTGTADILVKIFKTGPDIFVPNAFTPGGATNNIFRPLAVGVSALAFFRVYNRWGQLVYGTTRIGDGWDGRINGRLAESGTFIWAVQGTTYTGRTVYHRGTMVLVR